MSKYKYIMKGSPESKITKKEYKELDKLIINALYESMLKAGKITIDQIKYLENNYNDYWAM